MKICEAIVSDLGEKERVLGRMFVFFFTECKFYWKEPEALFRSRVNYILHGKQVINNGANGVRNQSVVRRRISTDVFEKNGFFVLFWNINGLTTRKVVFLELMVFLKSRKIAMIMLNEINLDSSDFDEYNDMALASGYRILTNIQYCKVKKRVYIHCSMFVAS